MKRPQIHRKAQDHWRRCDKQWLTDQSTLAAVERIALRAYGSGFKAGREYGKAEQDEAWMIDQGFSMTEDE